MTALRDNGCRLAASEIGTRSGCEILENCRLAGIRLKGPRSPTPGRRSINEAASKCFAAVENRRFSTKLLIVTEEVQSWQQPRTSGHGRVGEESRIGALQMRAVMANSVWAAVFSSSCDIIQEPVRIRRKITMTQQQRLISVLSTLVVLLGATTAIPAGAEGNMQVSGRGAFDSTGFCGDPPDDFGAYTYFTVVLEGDLLGCLYTKLPPDSFAERPSGVYEEHGEEVIVACLQGGPCGRLFTSYHFTAKYDAEGQVFGRCQHPIVGADGGFEGATGRLDFKDNIVDGVAVDFEYRGHIQFD